MRPDAALHRMAAGARAGTGWRRAGLAVLLGALAAAAMPPVYAVPLLIPAFTGLLWQLDGVRTARGAAVLGWAFGLGHFATGLYWVGLSFFAGAPQLVWAIPFAVAGLAAGLAVFPALAVLATWCVPVGGGARVLVFAAAWTLAAWLRGHVLTGFPWNLLGTVWTFADVTVQSTAWWGVWGLTLITVLAAAAPAAPALPAGSARLRWSLPVVAYGLLAAVMVAGAWRLAAAPPRGAATVEGVRLRLVQASIPQTKKWDRDLRRRHLRRYIAMSRPDGDDGAGPTHVIWPESAVPYFLGRAEGVIPAIARAAPDGGALLTGVARVEDGADGPRLFNSVIAVTPGGTRAASYDKAHLVPFGEYMPLAGVVPWDQLARGGVGYTAGPGPRVLAIPGAPPVSPLICYEAIFPGGVVPDGKRPGWLLNVSNDAWFGTSAGPYQHLAAARLRAVERGLPLVRAANSGISVVVDAHGRTLRRLGLMARGTITAPLPRALGEPTLYARFGDAVPGMMLLVVAAMAVRCRGS